MPDILPCTRRKKCFNKKVVVIDANFLFNIIELLVKQARESHPLPQEQYDTFLLDLELFLDKIRMCCYDGRFHVSRRVFEGEIDPTNETSSLYTKSLALREICRLNRQNYSGVLNAFQSRFHITPVKDSDIRCIKNMIRNPDSVGDNDLSLVVVALKKSRGQSEAWILTDDESFDSAILDVVSGGVVKLSFTTVNTTKIAPSGCLAYLTELHDCCEMETSDFDKMMLFKIKKGIMRADQLDTWEKIGKFKKIEQAWERRNISKEKKVEEQRRMQSQVGVG